MISLRCSRRAREALILSSALFVHRVRAQVPSGTPADDLFSQAREEMKKKDFKGAREHLEAAVRLDPTVGTLLNLALCEEKLGLLNDSAQRLRRALQLMVDADRRRPLVEQLLKSLEPRVPRLRLAFDGDPPKDLVILFDGTRFDLKAASDDLRFNPGAHQLSVSLPGTTPQSWNFEAREGETLTRTINVPSRSHQTAVTEVEPFTKTSKGPSRVDQRSEEPISNQREAIPDPGGRTMQRLGAASLVGGGVGVVAGAVMGFMALGRKNKVDLHCHGACDAEGFQASTEGATLATASTVSTVAGVAGVGLGSFLLLRDWRARPAGSSDSPGPTGYVATAVGGLGLAASATAAFVAVSAERDRDTYCDASRCDQGGLDAIDRGRTASLISTVTFGIGVGGLALGSYLLVLRPAFRGVPDVQVALAGTGLACRAEF